MNAYSRMRSVKASKSRSMDFELSDLALDPIPEEPPKPTRIRGENRMKNPSRDREEKENFGIGVMKLKRNSSDRSSSSGSSPIKYAVNRAFSMRRSPSVSERYCRIHDQTLGSSFPFAATIDEEEEDDDHDCGTVGILERTRSVKKKKKKSSSGAKILKTCKKLLGLS